jgi:hypothetical protein
MALKPAWLSRETLTTFMAAVAFVLSLVDGYRTYLYKQQSVIFAVQEREAMQSNGTEVSTTLNISAFNLGTSNVVIASIRAEAWLGIQAPDAAGRILHGGSTISDTTAPFILRPREPLIVTINLTFDLKEHLARRGSSMRVRRAPRERCIIVGLRVNGLAPDTEPVGPLLAYPFMLIRVNPDGTLAGGGARGFSPDLFEAPTDQYAHTSWALQQCEVDRES